MKEEATRGQIIQAGFRVLGRWFFFFLISHLLSEFNSAFGNCVTTPPSVRPSDVEWNRTAECQNLSHFSSFLEQVEV